MDCVLTGCNCKQWFCTAWEEATPAFYNFSPSAKILKTAIDYFVSVYIIKATLFDDFDPFHRSQVKRKKNTFFHHFFLVFVQHSLDHKLDLNKVQKNAWKLWINS